MGRACECLSEEEGGRALQEAEKLPNNWGVKLEADPDTCASAWVHKGFLAVFPFLEREREIAQTSIVFPRP